MGPDAPGARAPCRGAPRKWRANDASLTSSTPTPSKGARSNSSSRRASAAVSGARAARRRSGVSASLYSGTPRVRQAGVEDGRAVDGERAQVDGGAALGLAQRRARRRLVAVGGEPREAPHPEQRPPRPRRRGCVDRHLG